MAIIDHPLQPAGRQAPGRIIVHSMGEYVGGIYAPDFLESLGFSAHALVTPDGDIIRCLRDDQMGQHAKGHNTNTLGIEFLVPGDHTYSSFLSAIAKPWCSDTQLLTGARWIAEWSARWCIGEDGIARHSDIDPDRKKDPGDGFDFDRLKEAIWTHG